MVAAPVMPAESCFLSPLQHCCARCQCGGRESKGHTPYNTYLAVEQRWNVRAFSLSFSLGLLVSLYIVYNHPHHENTRPEERFRAAPDEDVRRYVPGRGVVEGRRSREGLTVHQAATRGISWLLSGVRL